MISKEELIKIIEEMPEEQIQQMSNLVEKIQKSELADEITKSEPEDKKIPEGLDPLDTFMATVVHSLTNAMYELSLDAKRKEENVMAKRLEVYRKKVSDGWEKYKKVKGKKENSGEL